MISILFLLLWFGCGTISAIIYLIFRWHIGVITVGNIFGILALVITGCLSLIAIIGIAIVEGIDAYADRPIWWRKSP